MGDGITNCFFYSAVLHSQNILTLLVREGHLGRPILENIGVSANDLQALNWIGIENIICSDYQLSTSEITRRDSQIRWIGTGPAVAVIRSPPAAGKISAST